MFPGCLKGCLCLSFSAIATFVFVFLYIMISQASLHLSSRLKGSSVVTCDQHYFYMKYIVNYLSGNIYMAHNCVDVFRCLLMTNLAALRWAISSCSISSLFHLHVFTCTFDCIVVCPFSVGHCIVCLSSIYDFLLPLWYL